MAEGRHREKLKSAIEQYLLMQRPVRVKSAIHRVGKSRIICYVIYFAVLLGEIGKVDYVAYNSTFAYSVYGTFDTNRPLH